MPEMMLSLIRTCRNYFDENSTQEMIDEWFPMLEDINNIVIIQIHLE